MSEITCEISVNEEDHLLTITGLNNQVDLDYTSDVDFTQLVKELTVFIDEEKTVKLELQHDTDDKKLEIILKTIENIFSSFDEAININSDEDNHDDESIESLIS